MLDKLHQIVNRYEELIQEMSSPELLSNPSAYAKVATQHRTLGEVVQKYQAWKGLKQELADARHHPHLHAGSAGGTFVNDEPVARPRLLRAGDRIRVGKSLLLFGEKRKPGSSSA